jgi:hypothetical protein
MNRGLEELLRTGRTCWEHHSWRRHRHQAEAQAADRDAATGAVQLPRQAAVPPACRAGADAVTTVTFREWTDAELRDSPEQRR